MLGPSLARGLGPGNAGEDQSGKEPQSLEFPADRSAASVPTAPNHEPNYNQRDLEAAESPPAAAGGTNEKRAAADVDVGWRPWKVVIGCFWLIVPTYGLLSTIGLFTTHWEHNQLQDYSAGDISWIISIFGFLACFFGGPSGVLFDRYGSRWLLPIGSVGYVVSFVGLAFSSTYGQFMGCCVVAGTSAAILSTIAFTVIPQWFKAHEGLATGCVTLGSAVGGIFFSLVLQALFNKLVWSTASLVLAGIHSGFLILGCALVETNLPERTAANGDLGRVLDMSRSLKFWLVVYVIFASEVVLYICWGSIPSIAVATKFGESQFYLMMAYNIGSIVGRTLPPFLSDRKFGPINTATIMTIFTLLTVLVIWLPFGTLDVAALYVVVGLMGIGTGSFVPLGVSCVSALCEPGSTGTWLGSAYTIISIATLIANPVTAAIFGRYGSDALVAFLAAILSSGLISVIALRWVCHGQRWVFKGRI